MMFHARRSRLRLAFWPIFPYILERWGTFIVSMMDDVSRLTPMMSSRKLLVLAFIQRFYADRGCGPSLTEIGAGCGITRQRAQIIVRKLAKEGRVRHAPGEARSVRPLSVREEALRVLREDGFIVNLDALQVDLPLLDLSDEEVPALTITRLPLCAHSDHIDCVDRSDGAGNDGDNRAG